LEYQQKLVENVQEVIVRTKQVALIVVTSVVIAYAPILLFLRGTPSPVCRADCDPGACVAPGLACCNGDTNGDHTVDITDPLYLLNYLFIEGPAPVAFAASAQNPEDGADLEFARCIAGSYISTTAVGKMLTTFGANGSIIASSNEGWNAHGTWWKTGPRQVTALTVSFAGGDGEPSDTVMVRTVSDFNEDCTERTVAMQVDLYDFPSNPIEDPDVQPHSELDGYHTSKKIQ
jgi:hypothetical protein